MSILWYMCVLFFFFVFFLVKFHRVKIENQFKFMYNIFGGDIVCVVWLMLARLKE